MLYIDLESTWLDGTVVRPYQYAITVVGDGREVQLTAKEIMDALESK